MRRGVDALGLATRRTAAAIEDTRGAVRLSVPGPRRSRADELHRRRPRRRLRNLGADAGSEPRAAHAMHRGVLQVSEPHVVASRPDDAATGVRVRRLPIGGLGPRSSVEPSQILSEPRPEARGPIQSRHRLRAVLLECLSEIGGNVVGFAAFDLVALDHLHHFAVAHERDRR